MLLKIIDLFSNESPDQFGKVMAAIENSFYPVISENDINIQLIAGFYRNWHRPRATLPKTEI